MGMPKYSKWGSGSLVVDESSGDPELKWRVHPNKQQPFGGWKPRRGQWQYLDENEDEVCGDLRFGLSPKAVAKKHHLSYSVMVKWMEEMGIAKPVNEPQWEPPKIIIPPVPNPPTLEPGKIYVFKQRVDMGIEHRSLRYVGHQEGRCPGGRHYLFQNIAGAKYSYTVYQLLEHFVGRSK